MSIGRVTSGQLYTGAQQSMATVKARLSVLQQQATDGNAITKPSDDPTGTASLLRVRSDMAANAQYTTNIGDGLAWLGAIDGALGNASDLITSAKDLTVQAASTATSTPATRAATVAQLQGISASLLTAANTTYLGRSVFAGTSDAPQAFQADGTYTGGDANGNTPVTRRISPTESVVVSADGAAAFGTPGTGGTPGTSVFETIGRITTALQSPDYDTDPAQQAIVSAGIDDLGKALTAVSQQRAVEGANYDRLTAAKTRTSDLATSLETQRSDIQDVDPAKVILDLKTQELAYQTALGVTAQVLQPTLMSFLQ